MTSGGFNYGALAALAGGIGVALLGMALPALRWLSDSAWFAGFAAGGALHGAHSERKSAISAAGLGEES